VLLVEVDGLRDDLQQQADAVVAALRATGARDVRLAKDDAERLKLWKGRKQAFGALGRLAPNYYTHDGVIPRTKLPEVLAEIGRIAERNQVLIANVFHAGDGNLHPVVLYDEREPGVIDRVRAAGDAILDLVINVGGALSGEHGIGLEKIGYMGRIYSEEDLAQMRRLRDLFNPKGLCNPGKLIPSPGRCVEPGASTRKLPLGH
jgi:glycolate oxidase